MDRLTGLPCRQEVFALLAFVVDTVAAQGKRLVVALVDVDRFYRVNETKGMTFGNDVLKLVSKRLNDTRTENSIVSRLGGNTFIVGLPVEEGEWQELQAVEAVKNAVERPIEVDGEELYLTSSIGATVYPRDGLTSEELVCRAESALHQSKEKGGNQARFYHPEDTRLLNRRISIESELRPALSVQQFHLSYQPVYRTQDGRLRGYEALIRWNHPKLGVVSPNEFIEIAEHTGLIIPIGEWVLREACRKLARMREYGLKDLIIAINVSPVQLQHQGFPQSVLHIIAEYGLNPASLELEITENDQLYSSETAALALSRLRSAGVRIALDDFGVGFSSLAHLKHLPIQCLKIDKSFIRQIDLNSAERIIVEGVINLVHKLGIEVIAEGVEYEEQFALLQRWGCSYAQGFLLGMPKELDKLDSKMLKHAAFPLQPSL
jgi:diguanylate cyclase (GGDEF)-like protein